MRNFSPIILRIGLGAVIIWFSLQQLSDPLTWTPFLPLFTKSLPISQVTLVYLNGWFELVFGILMIIGFYTRIVATLLGLHLLGIVYSLGYNSVAIRDFGLFIALISISLYGPSDWSLDKFFERKSRVILNNN